MAEKELDSLQATLSNVLAFTEERLLDVTLYFLPQHVTVVGLLCTVYNDILVASDETRDARGKLKLETAIEMSVKNNFKRLHKEVSAAVDTDVNVQPEHHRVKVLTRLSLRLEEELMTTTWRRLIGSLQIQGAGDDASESSFNDGAEDGEIDDGAAENDTWIERGSSEDEFDDDEMSDDMSDDDSDAFAFAARSTQQLQPPHGDEVPAPQDTIMHGNLSIETPSGWRRRWFVLTDSNLVSFSQSHQSHPGKRAKWRRRNLIQLETVESIIQQGTILVISHKLGNDVHAPFQLCSDNPMDAEVWVATLDEHLQVLAMANEPEEEENSPIALEAALVDPKEAKSVSADDPLLHGLQILTECVIEETADVLENTRVDPVMMECMVALQALDKRMVKVYNKTSTSRMQLERGQAAPLSLIPLDTREPATAAPFSSAFRRAAATSHNCPPRIRLLSLKAVATAVTTHAVGPWVNEKKQQFDDWSKKGCSDETWEATENWRDDESCACAASVVTLFQMLAKAVAVFEESGMRAATSAELRREFVQGIAAAMESYIAHVGTSCGPKPALPRCHPPKRGTKANMSAPKKPQPPTEFSEDVETNLARHSLEELITRINSLVFAQRQLEDTMGERHSKPTRLTRLLPQLPRIDAAGLTWSHGFVLQRRCCSRRRRWPRS